MIDEKDPNDETPDAAERTDATPQGGNSRSDDETDSKISDDELDNAAGGRVPSGDR